MLVSETKYCSVTQHTDKQYPKNTHTDFRDHRSTPCNSQQHTTTTTAEPDLPKSHWHHRHLMETLPVLLTSFCPLSPSTFHITSAVRAFQNRSSVVQAQAEAAGRPHRLQRFCRSSHAIHSERPWARSTACSVPPRTILSISAPSANNTETVQGQVYRPVTWLQQHCHQHDTRTLRLLPFPVCLISSPAPAQPCCWKSLSLPEQACRLQSTNLAQLSALTTSSRKFRSGRPAQVFISWFSPPPRSGWRLLEELPILGGRNITGGIKTTSLNFSLSAPCSTFIVPGEREMRIMPRSGDTNFC